MSSSSEGDARSYPAGAVEFLLRRMQRSRDFPALSENIRIINRLTTASRKSSEELAAVIVRDFALTNKTLKVVNSAYYAGFSGKVGTISRAIVILGIEPVRALAASLLLFEHLSKDTNAERIRSLIGQSMFSALLAREAAVDAGLDHPETAFLAGMFHNLGELLVAYYLPEEDEAIRQVCAAGEQSMQQAQAEVLGIDLERLAEAVGEHWNFPRVITHSMRRFHRESVSKPPNDEERVRQLANFSHEVTQQLVSGESPDGVEISAVAKRYEECLVLAHERLHEALAATRSEYRNLVGGLAASDRQTEAVRTLLQPPRAIEAEVEADALTGTSLPPEDETMETLAPTDPEPILVEGLQEVTAMLAEGANVNQVAQVILETLYRALGLSRVALCLHDRAAGQYAGRMGFGDGVDAYLAALRFDADFSKDVFHVALREQTDVYIADIGGGHGIPAWFADISAHGSLLFLPLVVRDRRLGCLIAEHAETDALALPPAVLRLVRALRNQFVVGLQIGQGARR